MRPDAALTGVLLSEKVFMLMDLLILSEDREGGEGLRLSSCSWCRSWRCRYSRHARWMLGRAPSTALGGTQQQDQFKIHILNPRGGFGGCISVHFVFIFGKL